MLQETELTAKMMVRSVALILGTLTPVFVLYGPKFIVIWKEQQDNSLYSSNSGSKKTQTNTLNPADARGPTSGASRVLSGVNRSKLASGVEVPHSAYKNKPSHKSNLTNISALSHTESSKAASDYLGEIQFEFNSEVAGDEVLLDLSKELVVIGDAAKGLVAQFPALQLTTNPMATQDVASSARIHIGCGASLVIPTTPTSAETFPANKKPTTPTSANSYKRPTTPLSAHTHPTHNTFTRNSESNPTNNAFTRNSESKSTNSNPRSSKSSNSNPRTSEPIKRNNSISINRNDSATYPLKKKDSTSPSTKYTSVFRRGAIKSHSTSAQRISPFAGDDPITTSDDMPALESEFVKIGGLQRQSISEKRMLALPARSQSEDILQQFDKVGHTVQGEDSDDSDDGSNTVV
eukprot:gb/GEZN01001368.1/.p1 GENE.gb/GEZN01001368.1/~~gb/GEZN01001368.1/.p1  ORF type:complete len:406 (+),score=40.20 gb/GEZN01001368.1/:1538-2755(+)